jgi:hypothetical protein
MEVDAFMSEQLLLMGFDQEAVTAALVATNNASVDAALEALLSQSYPAFVLSHHLMMLGMCF